MNSVLIVEAEREMSNFIKKELELQGYICQIANNGKIGADLIENNNYDLILLDINLPIINGHELLEYIKQISQTPVIFVTSQASTLDKIRGLKEGADDYVTKPFEIGELIARIEAVLRRYNRGREIQKIDNIEIDIEGRCVVKEGRMIALTPKEFDLLILLIRNRNFALYKELIYEKVWGEDLEFGTRTIDLHIQRLRKKLGWEKKIKTIYRVGYMLAV